jgi:hypothetical protein
MKVVVQHPVTHHFLDSTNQWKSNFKEARLFESACEAVSFGSHNLKPPYNVVLKFEDPQYDFIVLASADTGISASRTSRHY